MEYAEGVTICTNVIEGLRAEIELDESRAQDLWDAAALRRQALDDLEKALGVLSCPPTERRYWAFESGSPTAAKAAAPVGGCVVPTQEAS